MFTLIRNVTYKLHWNAPPLANGSIRNKVEVLTKTEETQEKHPNLKKKTEEISKVW
jgi:hypothetical protein